jgi:hypothetical protein
MTKSQSSNVQFGGSQDPRLDPEKKWFWVEDKEEGYIAGYVLSEDSDQLTLRLTTDEVINYYSSS